MNEPWWVSIIKAAIIINLVLFGFAYLTLAERKIMGRMQLRYGPNRAGPFGLLQPIADLMKLVREARAAKGLIDRLATRAPAFAIEQAALAGLLGNAADVDEQLKAWIKQAYEGAG